MTQAVSPVARVAAHAKVNLTLDILCKRADGYHEIASIFQTVSLADEVAVILTGEPQVDITADGPLASGLPIGPQNLAVRAATELLAIVEPGTGAYIHLVKRIPMQSGLGGGSSDAAAVLVGLCRHLGIDPLSEVVLKTARGLGADVTFFLTGGTARVTGIGEIVEPLPRRMPLSLVIARPEVGVSTAEAYRALDELPDRRSGRFTERWPNGGPGNDFEAAIFARHPEILAIRDALLMLGCRSATLCGSGSAVFGVAESDSAADKIARRLVAAGIGQAWAVRTVDGW